MFLAQTGPTIFTGTQAIHRLPYYNNTIQNYVILVWTDENE